MSQVMTYHGAHTFHRGINAPQSRYYAQGKFGRLFPSLPPHFPSQHALLELGKPGGAMDPGEMKNEDNLDIPAGFVFLGQFIDHDITFDPTSSLERQNDPEAIQNFRTPLLELDSVYGSGPNASPHFYEKDKATLLIDRAAPRDLPRNSIGTALIGDPRNDENVLISQLHLAFLKFHNAVVKAGHDFESAQQLVRWHYQWIVLHDFMPKMVGQELVDEVYTGDCYKTGRKFYNWRNEPFIPVEFAVAAYRFGHTQIPGRLKVNDQFRVNGGFEVPLFDANEIGDADPDDLSGGARADRRFVDWKYLFATGNGAHQPSKQIDTVLSGPLFKLPFFIQTGEISSLAQRNLLRGLHFSLPSGQSIARAMCIDPLTRDELADVSDLGFDVDTPLWFYILREAQLRAGGKRLGPVGGRIVAEVLIGLLEGDRLSFVRMDPKWKPTLGKTAGEFSIVDLLEYAGVLDLHSYTPSLS